MSSTTTVYSMARPAYWQDSNSAGAPLPRIPRRTSSSGARPLPTAQSLFAAPPPLVVQPPTPPRAEEPEASGSSSCSDSPVQFVVPRARRRPNLRPASESTPAPRVAFPAASPVEDKTPRASAPRPGLSVPVLAAAARTEPSLPRGVAAQLGQKRPLKSSLKARREAARGELSVVTRALGSKSEPTTPTGLKSVHFDTHLEHVKLFLAEQKPLAVSRDGSPREDTSGTESDFPAFIFGGERRGRLVMRVVNMPGRVDEAADVALEGLQLAEDGTAAVGTVRVRNLAFEKWVAIRFTLDGWQTTSEVTTRFVESFAGDAGAAWDRFAFTIRLADLLARIEDKTMFLAIRFSVWGREVWDNNRGENYQIRFSREKPAPPAPAPAPAPAPRYPRSASEDEQLSDATVDDLKSKLERVAVGRDSVGACTPPTDSPARRTRADSFDLRSGTPLSSRYDFAAAFKQPWQHAAPGHQRVATHPSLGARAWSTPTKPSASKDPALLTRGSPRMFDDSAAPSPAYFGAQDADDTPVPALAARRARAHQRGYFDLNAPHSLALRQPAPDAQSPARADGARYSSLDSFRMPPAPAPAPVPRISVPWGVERGGSEESTPSVTSSSRSSSPAGSPTEAEGDMFGCARAEGGSPTPSPSDANEYSVFLNKFCFYTGADSLLDVGPEPIQRSHSASSVEEFLSTSPHLGYLLTPGHTPTRSSSFDDVATISGSTTPTARSRLEAEVSTPVLVAH